MEYTKTNNTQAMITDNLIAEASEDTNSVMVREGTEHKTKHYKPIKRGGVWGKRAGVRGNDFIPFIDVKTVDYGSFKHIIFIV